MADTIEQAIDNALRAGASIEDINSLTARQGQKYQMTTIPQSEAPADFVEAPVGGVLLGDTAQVYREADEPQEAVQGPYTWSEEIPKSPDTNRRISDAVNAATYASATGNDPRIAYQAVKEDPAYDPDARAEMFLDYTGKSLQEVEAEIVARSAAGEAVPDILASKGISPITASSSEAMAAAKAFVASIPTAQSLTEKERDDVAFLKYLDHMTAKVGDDIGFNWRTVSDFAGYIVPQENLRYAQVAEVLGIDYKAMDYVDYTDFLARSSAYIQSEAPEKRQQMVETIIDAWPEIHGDNRIALVDFLHVLKTGINERTETYRHLESGIERVDQVSLGALASGKLITGALRSINAIRTATQLRNVEAVTDAVTAGARGELREAGVEPIEALATLDPSGMVNTLVKGADNTYATQVGTTQRSVDVYLDAANRVNSYGLNLSESEKALAHDRAMKLLENEEGISNLQVITVDEKTFNLTFNRADANGGPDVRFTLNRSYTLDDVGGLVSVEGKDYIPIDALVTSPNFRFVGDRGHIVQIPEQLQYQSAHIQGMYDGGMKAALKSLNSSEMKGVDYALTKGDEFVNDLGQNVGKVFTRDEAVVQGIEGVKLSEKQYEAYLDIQKVVENIHYAKNKEILEQYKVRNVKFVNWGGDTSPAKMYDTPEAALQGFHMSTTRSHWVGVEEGATRTFKEASELTSEIAAEMYAKGYRLTRAEDGRLLKNGNTSVEWAFVKKHNIREPHGIILNKRTGYMPKIKKDAFYFVKEAHDVTIGGTKIQGGLLKTVRYFDNNTDAVKYAEELNAVSPGKYRVLADRELSHSDLDNEFINIQGGLFTGARSEGVPFGLGGSSGTRADSLESLQKYIRNIARNAPMSLYREGIQRRWLNHAKDLGALPKSYLGSFAEAVHPQHLDLQNVSSKFLRDAHAQISFFTGVRTDSEMAMLANQRAVARGMEKIPIVGKIMSRRVLNSSLEGVTGAIRGVSFNLLLGSYNFAQFIIQASGGLVALSINPVHGLRALSQLPMYSAIDTLIASPAQKTAMLATLRRAGFDVDGYELWNKAGIREAVTTSNLDYHSLWSDLPYNANLLQKVLANSTVFYKNGELIAARLAFATSFNRWKALNPNKEVDIVATKAILARTEQMRLNMSRANAAKFQQGLLSVPTQFQQVNTKFFEKLLGRGELTKMEKLRLVSAQAALFGAAGVPIMSTVMPHLLDLINKFRDEENEINAINTDPATLNAIYNGGLAYMLQDYMDIESVISGRMALGQDFVENLFKLWGAQISIKEVALGPFNTIWENVKHGIERTNTAFTTVMRADDATTEDFAAVGKILARSVLSLPSSTHNLYKSYDMTESEFFKNKAGRPIAEWGDLNTNTIIAQAMGFAPQEVADYYEMNSRPGGNVLKPKASTQADRIVRLLADMHNESDEQRARWNAMAVNAIMTSYSRPEDRLEIIKQVEAKLAEPNDAWSTLMQKILVNWQSELNSGLAEIHKQVSEKSSPAVARQLAKVGMNKAVNEQQTKVEE